MVDGVTKLDKIHLGSAAEAETFRKLVLTAGRDIRVMIIKLADRLHNMRTIKFKKRPSQIRIAEATQDVLIPLADRLGLYVIKRELEDIVLETLQPEVFQRIKEHIGSDTDRKRQVEHIAPQVRRALRDFKVTARLLDRPRHPYSVYREMQKHPGTGPADPPRLVIVVDGPLTDCYAALGAIHRLWKPLGGKFRDLIAAKKFNLYQSIHTAVAGPGGLPIEFLIRTREMHETAEVGIVAGLRQTGGDQMEIQLPWLQRLLDWQNEVADSGQFLDSSAATSPTRTSSSSPATASSSRSPRRPPPSTSPTAPAPPRATASSPPTSTARSPPRPVPARRRHRRTRPHRRAALRPLETVARTRQDP
nr:hypothetical protein GCM10025732_49020 [Glycomyces mayteni]